MTGSNSDSSGVFGSMRTLIDSRQTVLPKRLVEPGPTPEQLDALARWPPPRPTTGC